MRWGWDWSGVTTTFFLSLSFSLCLPFCPLSKQEFLLLSFLVRWCDASFSSLDLSVYKYPSECCRRWITLIATSMHGNTEHVRSRSSSTRQCGSRTLESCKSTNIFDWETRRLTVPSTARFRSRKMISFICNLMTDSSKTDVWLGPDRARRLVHLSWVFSSCL